jgi:curved DNA-binding protein
MDKKKLKNYYEILKVDREASNEEIKVAYKKLVKKFHPDRSGADTSNQFKEVSEAYKILSDYDNRQDYDMDFFPDLNPFNDFFKQGNTNVSNMRFTSDTMPSNLKNFFDGFGDMINNLAFQQTPSSSTSTMASTSTSTSTTNNSSNFGTILDCNGKNKIKNNKITDNAVILSTSTHSRVDMLGRIITAETKVILEDGVRKTMVEEYTYDNHGNRKELEDNLCDLQESDSSDSSDSL